MKIYNTLTRQIEDFIPNDENNVKMYTCGPTVYHYAHIGNLRTYVFEDILEKTLRYVGYPVTRVMNITDVGHLSSDSDTGEDKMLKGAARENKTVLEIADFYTKAFMEDIEKLNIKIPDIISKATDNIDIYIKMISELLNKGYAYESNGNIYFDITKLEDYYKLTNHKIDEMVVGVREGVEQDSFKKNQADFVLWFTKSKFAEQELKWDSPFGIGYPGWHIECSGISMKYLGENLDIHCGAVDNIFPHHTNEIAQSEAYLGHKWCNYWCHGEHLNDKMGKMSKSNGEFLTISLLESKGYNPLAYRFLCLNSHYRKTLIFSFDILDSMTNAYNKLLSKINNINVDNKELNNDLFDNYKNKFKNSLEDDLNTSNAITILFDVLKDENINGYTKLKLIEDFDNVLSLDLIKKETKIDEQLEKYINEMIEKRNEAKKNKDFIKADQIRDELLSKNILIKDTREKTIFEIL
ncbi:MAG: cysteine--tRNA ligase [Bacilli bacterium]|nr:cysteine--tRNA ligase [Bacilli bacterium]